MVIKINPARLALWRDAHTLQLGLGREAITLKNLGESQERFINLLYRGIATDSLQTVVSSIGLHATETDHLMRQLRPALLDDGAELKTADSNSLHEEFVRQAFAEIIRASFENNVDGRAILQARVGKEVNLSKLNKTALILALALASAGIGSIFCDDDSAIQLEDTGLLGFDRGKIGKPKNEVLAELVNQSQAPCTLRTKSSSTGRSASQLNVIVASHPLSMADFQRYEVAAAKVPPAFLAIELGIEQSRVSPVIRKGQTPCLDCRNLDESNRDGSWAALASQLRFRKERLDDSQTSLLCAGFALEKCLRFLDARQPPDFEAHTIDHRTGLVQLQTWQKQAACGC